MFAHGISVTVYTLFENLVREDFDSITIHFNMQSHKKGIGQQLFSKQAPSHAPYQRRTRKQSTNR